MVQPESSGVMSGVPAFMPANIALLCLCDHSLMSLPILNASVSLLELQWAFWPLSSGVCSSSSHDFLQTRLALLRQCIMARPSPVELLLCYRETA